MELLCRWKSGVNEMRAIYSKGQIYFEVLQYDLLGKESWIKKDSKAFTYYDMVDFFIALRNGNFVLSPYITSMIENGAHGLSDGLSDKDLDSKEYESKELESNENEIADLWFGPKIEWL